MQRSHQLVGGVAVLCVLGGVIVSHRQSHNSPARPRNAQQPIGQAARHPLAPLPAITVTRIKAPNPGAAKIVASAKKQIGNLYDPSYTKIAYPGGDVERDRGVCSDVIVRALRSTSHDLQRLVHEDMKRHFSQYPKNWGLKRPDPNIDHRRVPNLMRFFERHGRVLTKVATPATAAQWQPGDIVCWRLPNNLYHTGIVSDRVNDAGLPFVIHNLGTCREEDCLSAWKIIGHYRYPPPAR